MNAQNKILLREIMIKYFLLKEEPNNSGFKNKEIEKEFIKIGWKPGDSWCGYMAKIILFNFYNKSMPASNIKTKILDEINQFSGSPMDVRSKVKKGVFKCFTTTKIPEMGAYTIYSLYKKGKESWKGHGGIVQSEGLDPSTCFSDFEGNTNTTGSSNGDTALYKFRPLSFKKPASGYGLRLKDFIILKDEYKTGI